MEKTEATSPDAVTKDKLYRVKITTTYEIQAKDLEDAMAAMRKGFPSHPVNCEFTYVEQLP